MIVIAYVFPKLQTVKDFLNPISWKRHVRASVDSQHVNGCQTLVKSAWENFYHNFWPLWGEMICKMPPLLNIEILRMFVNTLTVDHKYPVQYCENLHFPIQIQLVVKWKTFSEFFVPFMESSSNFKRFRKKDDRNSWCVSEITDCERLG